MKKKLIFFVVLVLMLTFGSFSVSAAGGPTVSKVTRISESGILIEFSEDVVIDEGKNPFFGIRMLDDEGNMLFVNGGAAQFYNFDVNIIDGKTILLSAEEGILKNMLDQTGTYAFYRDFHVRLCIEEMFEDNDSAKGDGTVYNIKSRATGQRLVAHYGGPNAFDGCYCVIEKNYNYYGVGGSDHEDMDDPNVEKPADDEVSANTDNNTFIPGDATDGTVSVIHEGGNEDIMWIALGVAAIDFVGILAIIIVLLAKKKKSK